MQENMTDEILIEKFRASYDELYRVKYPNIKDDEDIKYYSEIVFKIIWLKTIGNIRFEKIKNLIDAYKKTISNIENDETDREMDNNDILELKRLIVDNKKKLATLSTYCSDVNPIIYNYYDKGNTGELNNCYVKYNNKIYKAISFTNENCTIKYSSVFSDGFINIDIEISKIEEVFVEDKDIE